MIFPDWEKSQSERRAYLQGHEEIRDRFAPHELHSGLRIGGPAGSFEPRRHPRSCFSYWVARPERHCLVRGSRTGRTCVSFSCPKLH